MINYNFPIKQIEEAWETKDLIFNKEEEEIKSKLKETNSLIETYSINSLLNRTIYRNIERKKAKIIVLKVLPELLERVHNGSKRGNQTISFLPYVGLPWHQRFLIGMFGPGNQKIFIEEMDSLFCEAFKNLGFKVRHCWVQYSLDYIIIEW